MQDTTENYIHLEKVSKIYGTKEVKIIAVDEITFNIAKGEFAVIVGPSGAGKTTVLNILGGMDTATSGEIWVDESKAAEFTVVGHKRICRFTPVDVQTLTIKITASRTEPTLRLLEVYQ